MPNLKSKSRTNSITQLVLTMKVIKHGCSQIEIKTEGERLAIFNYGQN